MTNDPHLIRHDVMVAKESVRDRNENEGSHANQLNGGVHTVLNTTHLILSARNEFQTNAVANRLVLVVFLKATHYQTQSSFRWLTVAPWNTEPLQLQNFPFSAFLGAK